MSKADSFFSSDQDANFGVRPEGHRVASFASVDDDPKYVGVSRDLQAKRIALSSLMAKEQIRTSFDEDDLAELAHSLKTVGQKTPILVYWSAADGKYVIIAGERRFRAAQQAGLEELACQVHSWEPDEAELVELQFVENAVRTDLNAIETALSYKRLQDLKGYSLSQLSERIGKNASTISRSLSLLKLPADIQQEVAKGAVPPSVALTIAREEDEGRQRELFAQALAGNLTRDAAQAQTAKGPGATPQGASSKSTKKWTQSGVTITVSYGRGVTLSDIASVLEERAKLLKSDGRTKKAA
jgi:ParB family transcriptional regulator, chromosome partitioning protein